MMEAVSKPSGRAGFFFDSAGWSYDPKVESAEAGRARCAVELAEAEAAGRAAGLSFSWSVDADSDSSEFSDEAPAWELWSCVAVDRDGNVLASLGGIDFGRDGSPVSDPYASVVEAELAAEALAS